MNKKIEISPNTKGLIFDLDGTLIDSMPIHFIAWKNAAARYGIDFTIELFGQLAGIPVYPTVEKLNELFNKNIDPIEMGDAKEQEYEDNMHRMKLVDPVFEVVKKYHGQLPMAVGTGCGRELAAKALKVAALDQYFDIVVSADDVSKHKPHPETFLECARQMGVKPADCVVFEDGILGIKAAQTADMMVVDVTEYYTVSIGQEVY